MKRLQSGLDPHHLARGQLQSVAEQAGEQVQATLTRWGELIYTVSDLQELQQRRVLRALSVRVVQLQDQVPNRFRVKVHAVAKHLDVIDFHVAQVPGRVDKLQRFVVDALVAIGAVGLDAAP